MVITPGGDEAEQKRTIFILKDFLEEKETEGPGVLEEIIELRSPTFVLPIHPI